MKRYVAKAVKEGSTRRHVLMREHRKSTQAERASIRRLAFREWMSDIEDRRKMRLAKAAAR